MADVLELPLDLRAGAEVGPAFGAARLARLAVTGESPDAVCRQPALLETLTPRPERAVVYQQAQAQFRALYVRTKQGARNPIE
jgi:xylulokinase